jgi:hypothetical protein
MWFSYFDDPGNFIPLSVDRVNEIIALNKEGEKPDDISVKKEMPKVKLPDFENVVGQDSLNRFEHAFKAKKKKKKPVNKRPIENGASIATASTPTARPVSTLTAPTQEGAPVAKRKNKRPFKKKRPNSPENPSSNEQSA